MTAATCSPSGLVWSWPTSATSPATRTCATTGSRWSPCPAASSAGAAAAPAELAAGHGDHLDPVVAQVRVAGDVALVGHDQTRPDGEHVAAVIPLLALGGVDVLDGGEDPDGVQPQRRRDH